VKDQDRAVIATVIAPGRNVPVQADGILQVRGKEHEFSSGYNGAETEESGGKA
jgi:hypothetical protein